MFGWFRRRAKGLQPEAQWVVEVGPERIQVTDAAGGATALVIADLAAVAIETNDTGPWGADVWWLLFGADERLACAFPQGATGEGVVIDYLVALPGFDHEQMTNAMRSTSNAVFPVWRKAT
ncbi:MAG: hypothetical protein Q7J32_16005 [Sphingomonadaceae bacterium]|nr:hypothetical protein [Sphingomonadaceae bacterium]